MESLRGDADLIIDTSGLTPHELRDRIRDAFADAPPEREPPGEPGVVRLQVRRRRATPTWCSTCRFLPNPHWVEELRPLPGTDDRVRTYVRGPGDLRASSCAGSGRCSTFMVPGYVAEGKSYLTVAVGCTGGRHRSVVVVEELASFFRDKGLPASVDHRDLDR